MKRPRHVPIGYHHIMLQENDRKCFECISSRSITFCAVGLGRSRMHGVNPLSVDGINSCDAGIIKSSRHLNRSHLFMFQSPVKMCRHLHSHSSSFLSWSPSKLGCVLCGMTRARLRTCFYCAMPHFCRFSFVAFLGVIFLQTMIGLQWKFCASVTGASFFHNHTPIP